MRPTKSLTTLLNQVNKLAPNRNKASDGWIGDEAHSAVISDHNPNPLGIVLAMDITHDPKNGADMQKIADSIIQSKDSRIWYIIFNKRIWEKGIGWKPYHGSNPHTKHAHFNNVHTASLYDKTNLWKIGEEMFTGRFENKTQTKSAEGWYGRAVHYRKRTIAVNKELASLQAKLKTALSKPPEVVVKEVQKIVEVPVEVKVGEEEAVKNFVQRLLDLIFRKG